MRSMCGLIGAVVFLSASLCATAQAGSSTRKIVLPNPQLIRCHAAGCSQLWKQDSDDGDPVYPAQVLTDLVKGEVVGLTAVYDKSVSTEEIRAAVNRLYGKRPPSFHSDSMSTWRIEEEQFAISIFDGTDGAKELTYLKFVTYSSGMKPGVYPSLVPAAHIGDCKKITVVISPFHSKSPRSLRNGECREQAFLIEATILAACLVIGLTAETTAALEDVFGENPRG